MPEIATAWVTLAASTRGMEKDVRQALNRVEKSAKITPQVDTSGANRSGRDFMSRFASSSNGAAKSAGGVVGKAFVGGFAALLTAGALQSVAQTAVDQFRDMLVTGLDFSKTLNTFQGVTRASVSDMQAIQTAARNLGSDTTLAGASASSAALAMTELAKAGFTVDEAMTAARGTLELATAGQMNAAQAAEIQANAINAYGLSAKDAAHVSDLLANAAIASSADVSDIGMSLQQVGGIAKGFGVSLDDTIAALGMFANAGIKGSDAGTLLKTTMQSITDQGAPAQGAIADLGLSLYDFDNQQFVGFRELFRQLDEAKRRMSPEEFQAQTNILFGSDAMRSAMLGNAEAFDEMFGKLQRVGAGAELADAQMQGLPGAVEAFKNTVESIQLSAFEAIGPSVTEGLNEFVAWTGEHKPELIGLFSGMAEAALGTGEAIGLMTAGAIKGFAAMAGGIGNTLATLARGAAMIADGYGADGVAADLREFADSANGWGESLYTAGDTVMDVVGQIGNLRDSIADASDGIIAKEELLRALGESSLSIFEGREIVIKDNTPEVTKRLKALGFEIRQMPDGQFEVVPITDPARAQLDQFRREYTAPIKPEFDVDPAKARATLSRLLSEFPQFTGAGSLIAPGVIPGATPTPAATSGNVGPLGPLLIPKPRAAGGLFLPGDAVIQPATSGLVQWAEPSTGGEAFIPLRGGARSRNIWAQTGRLLGVFEQGGIRGSQSGLQPNASQLWDILAQAFPQLQEIGGVRQDPIADHPSGRALDIMIPSYDTPEGKALGDQINAFIRTNASALGIDSTIWRDTWADFAGNSSTVAGHQNHIHAKVAQGPATGAALTGYSPYGTAAGGYGAVDPQEVADAEENLRAQQADVAIQEQQLRELKADATESQKMAAEEQLRKAKADEAKAVRELDEARRGEPISASDSASSSGMGGESLGQSIIGGMLQSLGLDGSLFSNPLEWPNVKSAMAAVNWGAGLLSGAMGGEGSTTSLGGGPAAGALSGIGLPGVADFLKPIGPQALTPNRFGQDGGKDIGGQKSGPLVAYNGPVHMGVDPRAMTQRQSADMNQAWRKNMSAVKPR